MECNRPPTWPSATVKKPSGRSACCGRRRRGTPSSGSLRWCLLGTSDPRLSFTSGSYLWGGGGSGSPCTHTCQRRPGSDKRKRKTVREAMDVWFRRTPAAGFSATTELLIKIKGSKLHPGGRSELASAPTTPKKSIYEAELLNNVCMIHVFFFFKRNSAWFLNAIKKSHDLAKGNV